MSLIWFCGNEREEGEGKPIHISDSKSKQRFLFTSIDKTEEDEVGPSEEGGFVWVLFASSELENCRIQDFDASCWSLLFTSSFVSIFSEFCLSTTGEVLLVFSC